MARHRIIQFKTLIIIAGLCAVAAVIFILRPKDSPTEPKTAANTDNTSTNNNISRQVHTPAPPVGLSTNVTEADIAPQPEPAEVAVSQPIVVVPTLTLGATPVNPATTKPENSIKLRQRYLAAVREGSWPKPKQIHKKTEAVKADVVPQPDQPAVTGVVSHTVSKGETLSSIAKRYYGDAGMWSVIYHANKQTIGKNPNRLRVGQKLVIPEQKP